MFPIATWRALFRVPLIRNNHAAVRILNDIFYLLIALHRSRRFSDATRLAKVYFQMIDSFVQYGQAEAKDTLDRLLAVPWFAKRKRHLYHLIATHTRIIECLLSSDQSESVSPESQMAVNGHVREFVQTFKELNAFSEQDEARVRSLVSDPQLMDEMLDVIFQSLEHTIQSTTDEADSRPAF